MAIGGLTQYARDQVRDKVLLGDDFTPPSTWYFAAYTTLTTDAGGGTEVTGGSYARELHGWDAGATGSGEASPDATITIPDMPACTILAVAWHDASTAGNMWIHKPLDAPITVTAGQDLTIPASDVVVRFR